jgi:hypothetical protein
MIKSLTTLCAAALLASAPLAQAAIVVDTGTPDGAAVGALAFDAIDWTAAQVSFAQASTIAAIQGHILGGAAGETFDVSLFAADAGQRPGTLLYTATATYGTAGWNGVAGLSGWTVEPGSYWVEFEVQGGDTLGASSATGALLDLGAPAPPALTASTSDAGFSYAVGALSVGLRVEATAVSAVPELAPGWQIAAGTLLLTSLGVVRRRR